MGAIFDIFEKLQDPNLKFHDNTLHVPFARTMCHGYTYLIPRSVLEEILPFPTHELNLVPKKKTENIGLISLITRTGHLFQAVENQYGYKY